MGDGGYERSIETRARRLASKVKSTHCLPSQSLDQPDLQTAWPTPPRPTRIVRSIQILTASVSLKRAVPPFQDTPFPQNAKQSCSFTASDIVSVIVGKKRTVFKFHSHILMKKSPFFQKCLTSGMIEQQTNEVILPEDSSRAFEIVAAGVYSRGRNTAKAVLSGDDSDVRLVMRAWVLADKYCMPNLQNGLIDELGSFWKRHYVHPSYLSWVADHTDDKSPLYRLVMDQMAYELKNGGDLDHCNFEGDLEKVLARPILSTRLLWKSIHAPDDEEAPAESPQKYHVPTNSQIGGTTSTNAAKRKREVDDNTEEPDVASKVIRQPWLTF